MKRLALALMAVAFAGIAWWLGAPLFLDEEVNEEFPMSASAVIPDTMDRAEVEALMVRMAAETHETIEPMPTPEAPNAPNAPTAIRAGRFRDVDRLHRGSGSATIYRLADGGHVLRLDDFEVTNGPDLRVLLAVHPDPMSRTELDAGGYVELAPLKGNVGSQNYVIPGDILIEDHGSVVIYCRPFHVLFSVAPLS